LESEWAGNPRLVGSNPTLSAPVSDQGSAFEWRRKRDGLDKTLEKVSDVPWNLLNRGLVTDSQKRRVYENGIRGRAEILKSPGKHSLSEIQENLGRFKVRVELPGEAPYEVKLTQSFSFGFEAEALKQGNTVECRVDPENRKRVLLVAPEPDQAVDEEVRRLEAPQETSAAATVAAGKTAMGTVKSAEMTEIPNPSEREGKIWQITMELRSESERKPWDVTIYQRVPSGAEELLAPGSEVKVGYEKRKSDRDTAIDWPGSSGGRFS
jgi:hypothetical protein